MSLVSRTWLVLQVLAALAAAQDKIDWSKDLATALVDAKAAGKIAMVCVNAKYVDGKKTEEPAAKGLREVVYKDARVVAKSREFIVAFLTPATSDGNKIIRTLGVEGRIVSPQHIFIHPEGDRIVFRKEYWSHGKGEKAVEALLALMDKAQKELAGAGAAQPVGGGEAPTGPERLPWIQEQVGKVSAGTGPERVQAIDLLVRNDKDGDCSMPLIQLLDQQKGNTELVVDVVRGLGRDKLVAAAAPIAALLTHKDERVRGNAAVSLEYIGDSTKETVAALQRAAGREKDVAIANHMYRALGRCGVGNAKVRSTLVKKCGSSKSEFASYGPTIALAYFVEDKKAARGVEKVLKRIGVPGGKRGGGTNTVKRGVLCWTLASIGDPKSGKFMREELIAKLENVKAFWVDGLRSFYESTALMCEGQGHMPDIEGGVRGFVAFTKGAALERYGAESRSLMDKYRKGRVSEEFRPKGDSLLGDGE
ncbi:MAG: HEAT repeat domain-containing protein [Planctomycetota bacterium]|jgi:hypothetical protein